MTVKRIRWFKISRGIPAALYHTENPIICLEYKDFDNLDAGVGPCTLIRLGVSKITLIHNLRGQSMYEVLKKGAQDLIDYAASTKFRDGNLYGIFWVVSEPDVSVYVGLAYASLTNIVTPVRGMVEFFRDDADYSWVTPQFAVPLQVDVVLPGEASDRFHRVSRYERKWVI